MLFDKIASVYFISKKIYINILALEMASPGNQHCAICIGTLSFPVLSVLWMASCFLLMAKHMLANEMRVQTDLAGAALGAKSDVCDCFVENVVGLPFFCLLPNTPLHQQLAYK